MELWIRSQDKTKLVKSNFLSLFLSDANWYIYTNTNIGEPFSIGKYKTKERALEVLDEIQNILRPKIIINFEHKPKYLEDGKINEVLIPREEIDYTKQLSTYVYEMPKE